MAEDFKKYRIQPQTTVHDASKLQKDILQRSKTDNLAPEIYNVKLYLYSPLINTNTGVGLTGEGIISEAEFEQAIINSEVVMKKYFKSQNYVAMICGAILKYIDTIEIRLAGGEPGVPSFNQTTDLAAWLMLKTNINFVHNGAYLYNLLQKGIVWASFVPLHELKNVEGINLLYKYQVFYFTERLIPKARPDNVITHVESSLKKLLPYLTSTSGSGGKIRWEVFQDTKYKIRNIAQIKLDIYGPFIFYYFILFNSNGSPIWLDYSVETGDLYISTFVIRQSGTQMFFFNMQTSALLTASTRWSNLVALNGFTIDTIRTSNNIINTSIPGGINFNGQNCINGSSSDYENGKIISTEQRADLPNLILLNELNVDDYTGYVDYKIIRYQGGWGDGVDGLGSIWNLMCKVIDFGVEGVDNPFGFNVSKTLAEKTEQATKPNIWKQITNKWQRGFEKPIQHADGGLITTKHDINEAERSARRHNIVKGITNIWKNVISAGWQYFSKELMDQINTSNNNVPSANDKLALPRVFSDPKPFWKIQFLKDYVLDAWTIYSSPAGGGGFVDYYIGAISKPTRNDEQFAISQELDYFYFNSKQNHIDKMYILNSFENNVMIIDTQDFPIIIDDTTFSGMPCLTPFTLEKWGELSTSTQYQGVENEKLTSISKAMFPTNNLYGAPNIILADEVVVRTDSSIFERPFKDSDGINGSKFTIWLKPINEIATSKQIFIDQLNGMLKGIYGGWQHDFTFYDIEGNKIQVGEYEDGTPKYTISQIAPNRESKPIIGQTNLFTNNLQNVQTENELKAPIIYNLVELKKTYTEYKISFYIHNPNSSEDIINVEAFALYQQFKRKGILTTTDNVGEYVCSFTNLIPNTIYTLNIKTTLTSLMIFETSVTHTKEEN